MDYNEAAQHLETARRTEQRSAQRGAWAATLVASATVLAIGVMADLEMWWIAGIVVIAFVALWAARPVRLRFDWSDRTGAWMVVGGVILAAAAYIVVQFPVRAAGLATPNLIGAAVAVVVILLLCRAGLARMARSSRNAAESTS